MKEDKFISWARFLLRLSLMVLGLFTVGIAVFLVHRHLDPSAYAEVEAQSFGKAQFGIGPINSSEEPLLPLSDLPKLMLYWVFLRCVVFILLVAGVMRQGMRILDNLASLKTFYEENIQAFSIMARYAFAMVILSGFNFLLAGGSLSFSLHFPIGPLLFALACVIIARVFEQGRQLAEEQKLFV